MLELLSLPEISFPAGFLWGSSTAGHQIEGENRNSQRWFEELEDPLKYPEHSGRACNSWELYDRDIELLKELKHQAYRMSIEWSRLEPEMGRRDQAALSRYCDMLEKLKEAGIKVFVTLHHFTHPQWFDKLGGFHKRENIPYFIRHVEHLAPQISQYVDGWNIFNEFNCARSLEKNEFKANCLAAHAGAYSILKSFSDAPVSTAHALVPWAPYRSEDELDQKWCELNEWLCNDFFFHAIRTGEVVLPYRDGEEIPGLKGSADYWALNYYTRHFVSAREPVENAPRYTGRRIKMLREDFYLEEFFPEALITRLARLRDLPVFITENGCSCDDDRLRIIYIAQYLASLSEAIRRGTDVRGYFYWSLLDNYEWGSRTPRFGLVDVNFETFARKPKASASFFREIIERNGITQQLILKYLPELKNWQIYR